MRFFCYTLGDESVQITLPPPELLAEMGAFIQEAKGAGVLVETGGLAPTSESVRVRYADGKFTVIDGPFAEAKELIGGWALLDVGSQAEAVEWAERFLRIAGGGESTIRQVYGADDFGPTK